MSQYLDSLWASTVCSSNILTEGAIDDSPVCPIDSSVYPLGPLCMTEVDQISDYVAKPDGDEIVSLPVRPHCNQKLDERKDVYA